MPVPRPFGLAAEDLDLEFAQPDRPALVTALLAACAAPSDTAFWWARTVGARHRALLEVLQASEGLEAIDITVRCAACGERADLSLPLADLQRLPADDDGVEVDGAGRRLRLRLATGNDLRSWHTAPPRSRDEMLRALLQAGDLQPGDEDRALQALADGDPLVAFSVHCNCPHCGAPAEHEVDIEAQVLHRLARRQHAVVADVHRLASHYGWTEAQVLAVAPARRARYLALIEGVA